MGGETAPAPPANTQLKYVSHVTLVLGALMTTCTAVVMAQFFGAVWASLWCVLTVGLLTGVTCLASLVAAGKPGVVVPTILTHASLIASWMAAAVALYTTGDPGAWVVSVMIACSWAIHIIFSAHRDVRLTMALLSIAALPLMGFLIWSAWSHFAWWAAAAGTVSAICMLFSIATSARIAAGNVVKLHHAMADASASRKRLEFAIDSVGDGYFEIDLEKMRYESNGRLAKRLGYAESTSTMDGLRDRVHDDDLATIIQHVRDARARKIDSWNMDCRVRSAAGDLRWMNIRARALEAPGVSRRLICTMVDLTERKRLEEELRAAKEAAEASNKAKSEFLANMSHEIRTPLNGVLGMAQALEAEEMTPAQREKVAIILDSGKSLTALLNDVLDLTKIEAGKLEISPVAGDFLHTMKRTRQLFQQVADDKGLELIVRYSSDFPQRITYDPVRVRQCIANLMSNAIKFTAKGSVEVAISSKPVLEGGHIIAIDVTDTGIGISTETQAKLFSVFTQADGATTRKFGGSGLGLAISRQLSRLMGGDLVVMSTEGKGSTFRLTFKAGHAAPAAQPASAPSRASAEPPKTLRGVRVLLTDDNAINRQVIKLFLAPHGCDISEATNGKEALDKIASQDFDIVLLDVHMPVMDGKEAIQRIRAASQPWSKLPVIALTADAMSGDREKYLALGMSDYVSKPVDQRELVSKMLVLLGRQAPAAPAAKSA